jgi:hypothetical protein
MGVTRAPDIFIEEKCLILTTGDQISTIEPVIKEESTHEVM